MKLKKKERTDEQKVRRGKIAIIAVIVIAIIALVIPSKKKDKQDLDPNALVRQEMDACLDSLLTDLTGRSIYEVYYKGDIENVPFIRECPEAEELERVKMQIRLLENEKIPNPNRKEELEGLYSSQSYLERKVEEFNEGPISKVGYNSRRIKFHNGNGQDFTCFQQSYMGHNRLKHLQELTKGANAQTEMQKLQKETEEN